MKKLLLFALLFTACKKGENHAASAADTQTAADAKVWATGKAFRIQSYTASIPIDYYPTDTIGPTLDLWQFVSLWIKDDSTYFNSDGSLQIYQGANLYSAITSNPIQRNWNIYADDKGVHMDYLTYQYDKLTYQFVGRTDSTITIQVPRDSAQLITVLKVLK